MLTKLKEWSQRYEFWICVLVIMVPYLFFMPFIVSRMWEITVEIEIKEEIK